MRKTVEILLRIFISQTTITLLYRFILLFETSVGWAQVKEILEIELLDPFRSSTNKIPSMCIAGTPSGVGPVKLGQKVTAGITGLIDIHFDVQRRLKPLSS